MAKRSKQKARKASNRSSSNKPKTGKAPKPRKLTAKDLPHAITYVSDYLCAPSLSNNKPDTLAAVGRLFVEHSNNIATIQSTNLGRFRRASEIYTWFVQIIGRNPSDMKDPFGSYIPPGTIQALHAFANVINTSAQFSPDGVQITNRYFANVASIGDVVKAIYAWYLNNGWTITRN